MEVEEGKMLFKLRKGKGSVHHFTDEHGVAHFPGDVVELPANYLGLKWLEPVEEAKKVLAAPSKVAPMSSTASLAVPLEAKKKRKSVSS